MVERRPGESDESWAKRLKKSEAAKARRRAKADANALDQSEKPSKKRMSSDGNNGSQSKKSKKDEKEKKPRKLKNEGILTANSKNIKKVVERLDYNQATSMLNQKKLWVKQCIDLAHLQFVSFPSYILITKNGITPELTFSQNDIDFIKLISDFTNEKKMKDESNPFFHPDSSNHCFWDYLFLSRGIPEQLLHSLWRIMSETHKYIPTMISYAKKHERLDDLKAALPHLF